MPKIMPTPSPYPVATSKLGGSLGGSGAAAAAAALSGFNHGGGHSVFNSTLRNQLRTQGTAAVPAVTAAAAGLNGTVAMQYPLLQPLQPALREAVVLQARRNGTAAAAATGNALLVSHELRNRGQQAGLRNPDGDVGSSIFTQRFRSAVSLNDLAAYSHGDVCRKRLWRRPKRVVPGLDNFRGSLGILHSVAAARMSVQYTAQGAPSTNLGCSPSVPEPSLNGASGLNAFMHPATTAALVGGLQGLASSAGGAASASFGATAGVVAPSRSRARLANKHPLDNFLCPLTGRLMLNPVTAADGHNIAVSFSY
ncbi:hypothetical protein VOLCADRAFT_95589 [Volvox carteri f. nagariensis]|uniref:U-box domain-containing protein n=1 Tax=Volvox carteri f. nagariensis TaxID=3068 RepID=D8U807_VOLCA|nr:uncharacterized protein VOLCADRAFT_95589 [Volvox carteri f. nagariensis]EFJ44184.1 hypothetical protein VOLCADRAFT_95589 [Volvox carteri f. nagariensis]|eukprot:XP_002954778.1 hypothetical protein VOLCADRAFT_95589 [Volvox carteri f. nagariensis]